MKGMVDMVNKERIIKKIEAEMEDAKRGLIETGDENFMAYYDGLKKALKIVKRSRS